MTEGKGRTRIKICGITNLQDAARATEAGADYLGFVLYPRSPRFVTLEQASAITKDIRREFGDSAPLCVGVFVDEEAQRVQAAFDRAGLDLAQLHGNEPPSDVQALHPRAFKAVRPRTRHEAAASLTAYHPVTPGESMLPQLLLDAFHPQQLGGTGLTANWELAAEIARHVHLLLAGGLTPETVGLAIAQVRPWGVDVSSGVERTKGMKDPARLVAFVQAVRAADAARP
jgi:phosphoribosylanthranilate isomerase